MRFAQIFLVGSLAGCTHLVGPATLAMVVDHTGQEVAGPWGSWSALPGDANVKGPTLLRLSGPAHLRFVEPSFRGVDDAAWGVPIQGNLRLGWAPAPSAAMTWTNDTSISIEAGEAFVAYEIMRVSDPLPAQAYVASYVVERPR